MTEILLPRLLEIMLKSKTTMSYEQVKELVDKDGTIVIMGRTWYL